MPRRGPLGHCSTCTSHIRTDRKSPAHRVCGSACYPSKPYMEVGRLWVQPGLHCETLHKRKRSLLFIIFMAQILYKNYQYVLIIHIKRVKCDVFAGIQHVISNPTPHFLAPMCIHPAFPIPRNHFKPYFSFHIWDRTACAWCVTATVMSSSSVRFTTNNRFSLIVVAE